MRNLKKILALVLALVMSFSLMATAGAKDFTDKADIDATGYQDAVDVLAELEIIRGYENGSFQPNGDITRAEVAAIVYRIATKDVKDTQAGIYTSWNKFADVKDGAWYAGYVNYCANAEIVKGTSATTFEPENKVTGYQVLAMILRTMGYGKNGEFEGGSWAINTAAQAKKIGIIDNILEQKLGSPATRAMVAEILFRALLTEMVDYNAIYGYQTNDKTLGQTQFGLEEITGVVMANEYADLEGDTTLSSGKTRLDVDGKAYVLNVTTDLTDIGESRAAYVQKVNASSFNVLCGKLYDTGLNVRAESGDEQSSVKSFAKSEGLDITGAQHFRNFGYDTVGKSEWRIEYRVEFDNSKTVVIGKDKDGNPVTQTAQEWFEKEYNVDLETVFGVTYEDDDPTKPVPANERLDTVRVNGDQKQYTRVIPVGNEITVEDVAIMQGVFSAANDYSNNISGTKLGVGGYVYAGSAKVVDQHDLSSEMTWNAFREKYIDSKTDTAITSTENGEWLKVVDNNGDGVAEYVFRTVYCAEQVLSENTKYDYLVFGYYGETDTLKSHIDVNPNSKTCKAVNYIDDVEVGDIVLAALIDNKWQIEKADEDIKIIQTVNYREKTVTTTEGDVYDQSGIAHHNDLDEDILDMDEKVEYTVYFDHFGHVVAYTTEAAETNYALLSELYFSNDRNGKYVTNTDTIVEITMGEEKTVEKIVSNNTYDLKDGAYYFVGEDVGVKYEDCLQRAINHLGRNTVHRSVDYLQGHEFAYGKAAELTETNVAIYTYDEDKDTVDIRPAAKFAFDRAGKQLFYSEYDKNGDLKVININSADPLLRSWTAEKITEPEYAARYDLAMAKQGKDITFATLTNKWTVLKPVYTVDYVKLDISKSIAGNQVRYDMDAADDSYDEYRMHEDYAGNYVNATHETEYYVVGLGGKTENNKISSISYYKGYENLPKFAKEDIHAMYAVATNTTAARDQANYWVADVIVIEADAVVASHDSVALAYFNTTKSTGTTKHLDALDSMTEDPQVDLVPKKYTWENQWKDYWFYALYDTEVSEPSIAAGKITKITEKYNSYGIHAGTVYRTAAVYAKGDYVMVDKGDGVQKELYVGNVPVYGIVDYDGYEAWDLYELTTANLKTGDEIIYVYNKSGNTLKYIVVANFNADGKYDFECDANDWTEDLWEAIIKDQEPTYEGTEVTLLLKLAEGEKATATCGDYTKTIKGDSKVLEADELPIIVPNDVKFTFTLKVTNPVAALKGNDPYRFAITPTDEANVWSVTAWDSNKTTLLSEEEETEPTVIGTTYTVAAVAAIITEAKKSVNVPGGNTYKEAEDLAKELLSIVTSLVDGAAEIKVNGKDLDEAVVDGVVAANVGIIVATYKEDGKDLDEDQVAELTETLTGKVNEALNDETVVDIDKAVEDAVDATVGEVIDGGDEPGTDEPGDETFGLTLKANDGIEINSAWVGDEQIDGEDGVYTIDKDAQLVVVLTITGVEVTEDTEVFVYAQSDVAAAPVKVTVKQDVDVEHSTVIVTLPKADAAVTYTFTLEELK